MESWLHGKLLRSRDEMLNALEENALRTKVDGTERAYASAALSICKDMWSTFLNECPTKEEVDTKAAPSDEELKMLTNINASLRKQIKEQNKIAFRVYRVVVGKIGESSRTLNTIHAQLEAEANRIRDEVFLLQHAAKDTEFDADEFSLDDFLRLAEFKLSHAATQLFRGGSSGDGNGDTIDTDFRLQQIQRESQAQVARLERMLEAEKAATANVARNSRQDLEDQLKKHDTEMEKMRTKYETEMRAATEGFQDDMKLMTEEYEVKIHDMQKTFLDQLSSQKELDAEGRRAAIAKMRQTFSAERAKAEELLDSKGKRLKAPEDAQVEEAHNPWEGETRETMVRMLQGKKAEIETMKSTFQIQMKSRTLEWETMLKDVIAKYENELNAQHEEVSVETLKLERLQKQLDARLLELSSVKLQLTEKTEEFNFKLLEKAAEHDEALKVKDDAVEALTQEVANLQTSLAAAMETAAEAETKYEEEKQDITSALEHWRKVAEYTADTESQEVQTDPLHLQTFMSQIGGPMSSISEAIPSDASSAALGSPETTSLATSEGGYRVVKKKTSRKGKHKKGSDSTTLDAESEPSSPLVSTPSKLNLDVKQPKKPTTLKAGGSSRVLKKHKKPTKSSRDLKRDTRPDVTPDADVTLHESVGSGDMDSLSGDSAASKTSYAEESRRDSLLTHQELARTEEQPSTSSNYTVPIGKHTPPTEEGTSDAQLPPTVFLTTASADTVSFQQSAPDQHIATEDAVVSHTPPEEQSPSAPASLRPTPPARSLSAQKRVLDELGIEEDLGESDQESEDGRRQEGTNEHVVGESIDHQEDVPSEPYLGPTPVEDRDALKVISDKALLDAAIDFAAYDNSALIDILPRLVSVEQFYTQLSRMAVLSEYALATPNQHTLSPQVKRVQKLLPARFAKQLATTGVSPVCTMDIVTVTHYIGERVVAHWTPLREQLSSAELRLFKELRAQAASMDRTASNCGLPTRFHDVPIADVKEYLRTGGDHFSHVAPFDVKVINACVVEAFDLHLQLSKARAAHVRAKERLPPPQTRQPVVVVASMKLETSPPPSRGTTRSVQHLVDATTVTRETAKVHVMAHRTGQRRWGRLPEVAASAAPNTPPDTSPRQPLEKTLQLAPSTHTIRPSTKGASNNSRRRQ